MRQSEDFIRISVTYSNRLSKSVYINRKKDGSNASGIAVASLASINCDTEVIYESSLVFPVITDVCMV